MKKKINKICNTLKSYIIFYKENLLRINTLNYSIMLILFLVIIMIMLSTYNVEVIKQVTNVQNSLKDISLILELLKFLGVCALLFLTVIIPYFRVQIIIPCIYTYLMSSEIYKVFLLSSSNNNINMMVIGIVIALFGIASISSICYKLNKIKYHKKEKIKEKFDIKYVKISLLSLVIGVIGIIIYTI